MTYEDSIEIIKDEIECVNRQFCERQCGLCDLAKESSEILQAYEMAIEAFEKADKYKWHDLRKSPDDLPHCEEEVEIAYERRNGYRGTARAVYEDGKMHSDESDFCWYELDEWCEYCEETDDYIIPEGWWEVTKFAENMGIVDVPVIAWRKIDPFNEVKE